MVYVVGDWFGLCFMFDSESGKYMVGWESKSDCKIQRGTCFAKYMMLLGLSEIENSVYIPLITRCRIGLKNVDLSHSDAFGITIQHIVDDSLFEEERIHYREWGYSADYLVFLKSVFYNKEVLIPPPMIKYLRGLRDNKKKDELKMIFAAVFYRCKVSGISLSGVKWYPSEVV